MESLPTTVPTRILVIDDEEAARFGIRKALEKEQYLVELATNGQEALQKIREFSPQVVISDINMPKVNGLELKRMIEGIPELKLRAIPFIFTSTSDEPLIVKEAFSLGIQGYIKKSDNLAESVSNLDILIRFWSTSVHPNQYW